MITKLGKYNIIGELGQGAMGTVYKGEDPVIGRIVAIKTINRSTLSGPDAEEAAARFKQEAQANGRVNHPNIVVVYDYGEDEEQDSAFIAMAFVEGRELKTYFDNKEVFSLADIVRIMDQLLGALGSAHAIKIVHRDIKPGNIMINDRGNIMITDFGIARLENSDLTQVGATMGTPNYMAPEQCIGVKDIDGRADLFSAAVILYQFLTGEKPFAGANIPSIMHKIMKVDPVPPSELNMQIPKAFDSVIAKGLAKRPDDRFATAADFSNALKAAADGIAVDVSESAIPAAPVGTEDETIMVADVTSVGAADLDQTVMAKESDPGAATPPGAAPAVPVPETEVKKSKLIPILAGVGLVALLATGVFMFSGGKDGQDSGDGVVPPAGTPQTQVSVAKETPTVTVAEAGIFVETSPAGAMILLDGKSVKGVTPLNLDVATGHHELLLLKDGYFTVPIDLEIKDGDMIPLTVSLYRQ